MVHLLSLSLRAGHVEQVFGRGAAGRDPRAGLVPPGQAGTSRCASLHPLPGRGLGTRFRRNAPPATSGGSSRPATARPAGATRRRRWRDLVLPGQVTPAPRSLHRVPALEHRPIYLDRSSPGGGGARAAASRLRTPADLGEGTSSGGLATMSSCFSRAWASCPSSSPVTSVGSRIATSTWHYPV